MAAISSITGISDAALTGQVEKAARPVPEQDRHSKSREMENSAPAKENQQAREETGLRATAENSASYEETMEVAEKLQSRINEVASVAHTVSIRTDEQTRQYVIEIQDPEGQVVKQFPSEKVLNLHQKLDDLSGMVIDEMI